MLLKELMTKTQTFPYSASVGTEQHTADGSCRPQSRLTQSINYLRCTSFSTLQITGEHVFGLLVTTSWCNPCLQRTRFERR